MQGQPGLLDDGGSNFISNEFSGKAEHQLRSWNRLARLDLERFVQL